MHGIHFRKPEFIAHTGGQAVVRHQLPGNLPRQLLIDTALEVEFLAQLLRAREIGLLGIGLGAAVLGVSAKTTMTAP